MKEFDFEKAKRAVIVTMSKELIEMGIKINGSDHMTFMKDSFTVKAIQDQLVGKYAQKIVKYPEDWQQSLKERWLPRWLLKKTPVKYVELDAWLIVPNWFKEFPHLKKLKKAGLYAMFAKPGDVKPNV